MTETENAQILAPKAAPAPNVQKNIKAPKKRRRWPKVLLVLAILAGLVGWFIVRPMMTASQQISNAMYTPVQVERRDITVSISGTATVEANDSYQVTAAVRGEILEAPFEEGDQVAEGDLLYTIDSRDVRNTIERSQVSVEQSRLSYQDMQNPPDDEIVTANATGMITALHVEEGDTVTAGTPLAEILDRETVLLDVPFQTQVASQFCIGETARINVNGNLDPIAGTVTEIGFLDTVTTGGALVRTVTIEAVNPGGISERSTGTAEINGQTSVDGGTFRYRTSKTLTAKAMGDVTGLTLKEGDWVTEGQELFRLTNDVQASDAQIENARLSLKSAELALQAARDSLEDYTITSPISGTVVEKNYKAGDDLNNAAGPLAVIFDLSSLKLEMMVDELYIGRVAVGQAVEITADALEGQTFAGRVSRININGTTLNGVTSYPVTIVIDEAGGLLPGMNVNAEILVERAEQVLAVPVAAVQRGSIVLFPEEGAISADGNIDTSRLTEREVALGRNDDDYIEITSGLEEGDTVVIRQTYSTLMDMMMSMNGGMVMTG